ncbi:MAG: type II CRISPR RNA-guided endonuclease Cas9 [Butyricicoccus sp.]|nr:type II CRISPR RNA-guided endonuclease Cas9 [Butyricicoccus sp.]
MSLRYTLGLDIGIASVGWAVLENNIDGEPIKIERLGVRIFDKAEQPKTGASLAEPRREARGQRRTIRRRRHRKDRIKQLIQQNDIMTRVEMAEMFEHLQFETSVYELRVQALERALTKQEFVRVLIHLAQRRGYKSNSKSEEAKDKENGKVKSAISENKKCMEENGYRTIGEMLLNDDRFWEYNPDGTKIFVPHNHPDDYRTTVERSMVEDEIRLIFSRQRALGVPYATSEFEEAYLEIWGSQRNFDEGPGGKSPYGGNMIEKMLGHCTFEKDEPRAAKGSYSAEYFRLLQDVNHLRLIKNNGESCALTREQKQIYIDLVMKSAAASYAQLRKKLELSNDISFNMLRYGSDEIGKVERKKLGHMKFYHEMRKALNTVQKDAISTVSWEQRDKIARILLCYKSDDKRKAQLEKLDIPREFIPALLTLSTSKTAHLSAKALRKLIPHLEKGMTYAEACKEVYGEQKSSITKKNKLSLFDIEPINNPVVRRAVSQTIRVINAVVREYGAPEVVRVELAREMGKPYDVRTQMTKKQEANAKRNEELRQQIKKIKGAEPTGQDIVKFKLFQDQNGVCLYSGQNLDITRLFEAGYVDVDHIIPYSISFDDSYTNKVLVRSPENRQKGNRIPADYFKSDPARWQRFETLVNTQVHNWKKKRNLLTQALSEEQKNGFKQRNLVDTQYIARVMYNLINDHLQFAETGKYDKKRRTQAVNGAITAHVRKRLGIQKIREDGDLHHAVDAAVVACVSPGMIQKVTQYTKHRECIRKTKEGYLDTETGELMTREAYDAKYSPRFPAPWERFRQELEARLSDNPAEEIARLHLATYDSEEEIKPVFVSRKQTHKISGAAHEATIRSAKKPGGSISKKPLTSLSLNKKTGEIEGYYAPESDRLLYEALKKRLEEFDGNAEKAFAEPFYKPKRDGTRGPLVKKVKIYEKKTITVPVGGGNADNGSMIRVDVFYIEDDGYYYVPIYTADVVKDELPNKAVVQKKLPKDWKEMDDRDFLFSMYPNDLLYIESRRGIKLKTKKGSSRQEEIVRKTGLYYFKGLNIATNALFIITHDNGYEQPSLGGKTLSCLKKYTVDALGNYSEASLPEKRKPLRG